VLLGATGGSGEGRPALGAPAESLIRSAARVDERSRGGELDEAEAIQDRPAFG